MSNLIISAFSPCAGRPELKGKAGSSKGLARESGGRLVWSVGVCACPDPVPQAIPGLIDGSKREKIDQRGTPAVCVFEQRTR